LPKVFASASSISARMSGGRPSRSPMTRIWTSLRLSSARSPETQMAGS
jgi:hypothetical protein